MCTGMEPALLAAAAAEAAPVIAAPAVAATVAPEVGAGLGAMMAGAAVPETAMMMPAITEAVPTTLVAADTAAASVLPTAAIPETPMMMPAADAGTFLGMSPAQWTQQLVTQGGSAGLQMFGASQAQNAQADTADAYNKGLSDWEKSQLAAVDEGMKGYTPEAIAANRQKYKDQMISEYDANSPSRDSFGNLLLGSTPDEVKQDYASKQATGKQFARDQYIKSLDLTSLGRALTTGAQGVQDALTKANMNKSVINSYMASLPNAMQQASGSGALAAGAGNLTSSLGNALLASQISSGKQPASALDIR